MEDFIEWKEAKGGQSYSSDSDNDEEKEEEDLDGDEEKPISSASQDSDQSEGNQDTNNDELNLNYNEQSTTSRAQRVCKAKSFSHQQLNLSLRRNITSLAASSHHKPKPTYASDSKFESFDSWLEHALVAISPSADLLLFSSSRPENLTFLAKLRLDPINQYVTKPLEIPLDYDEQVTSLLCLPIMSTQKTAMGQVDWTALVIGFSSGYVKFYNQQSICLSSFKFCDEAVLSLKCQTLKNNSNARSETHFPVIIDELLITHRSFAITIDGMSLYEILRIAKNEVVESGSTYEPAYNLNNLPSILLCQKWKIEDSRGTLIKDCDMLGSKRSSRFDILMSESIDSDHVAAKASPRALAFVGRNPFVACYRETPESTSNSYTEMIGSIFSLWNKPQPSKLQLVELTKSSTLSLFDKERLATSIVTSPDKRLAAVTDDFGRVSLIDATNWIVVRVWKGYRSAQCGWIEVKKDPEQQSGPHASFLVIYAPKRGLLEVWSVQRGPRVAAFNVGKNCRLLYNGYKMLNMRAEVVQKNGIINHLAAQSYSSHCYLLNPKSETIFSVEVPYTYSLYKYGDLKSRDRLLIRELVEAIHQDSEVEVISEILHRMALAESLEASIKEIVTNLNPDKIIPIMENLLIKTIKNYDNHSGELMTEDDSSVVELCKRIIRLCSLYSELSESTPNNLTLPDVNQRLIEEYEEHPQEIDEFAESLGWSTSEILRYLSLLALDRSYRGKHLTNPWPSLGEPLTWGEFCDCFNLNRIVKRRGSKSKDSESKLLRSDKILISLKEFNSDFLNQDKVMKTALFMYNRLSETYYRTSQTSTMTTNELKSLLSTNYNYIEPSSRLALLFQFWQSTKLCYHWKMWMFLQNQVGQISDELKVIAMSQDDDQVLIITWKQIYNLILESDNFFAAIIATATIKSDTLRMIQDNEKRKKLDHSKPPEDNLVENKEEDSGGNLVVEWECLCIDAERMSILSQQLEDVFLLSLLLKYSVDEGKLVDGYLYRVPRISVANILRQGPTIVSELVAQWAVQSGVNLKVFTQPYGISQASDEQVMITNPSSNRDKIFAFKNMSLDNEEHAKELLHHNKTSFPRSLAPEVMLLNIVWEFCRQWTANSATLNKTQTLKKAYDCLSLIEDIDLRHKLASVAFKTFFQRTFERLVTLVEFNHNLVDIKNSKLRDILTRKELNMGEECLEDFVQFCCDISEFMLQTSGEANKTDPTSDEQEHEKQPHLLTPDIWWTASNATKVMDTCGNEEEKDLLYTIQSQNSELPKATNSLIKTVLFTSTLFDVNTLVELNRLANLMNLIFKLRVVKSYPLSLIGEESRQILKIDSLQNQSSEVELKNRLGSVSELRQRFARKCVLNIVSKMSAETNEFSVEDDETDDEESDNVKMEYIDTKATSKFDLVRKRNSQLVRADNENNGNYRKHASVGSETSNSGSNLQVLTTRDDCESIIGDIMRNENNESMVLFANLLSLASEWLLNCDELYLELVFELYRCNHDKIAAQISTRVRDHQTLANGLLKISSQRVLVLFGLSPQVSGPEWRRRIDKWSIFQPNVVSWLKSIQQEEARREIAGLSFSASFRTTTNTFGIQIFVLQELRRRTKIVLENITNHLEGQAVRLAYDLLQLLESQLFDKLLEAESASKSPVSVRSKLGS